MDWARRELFQICSQNHQWVWEIGSQLSTLSAKQIFILSGFKFEHYSIFAIVLLHGMRSGANLQCRVDTGGVRETLNAF